MKSLPRLTVLLFVFVAWASGTAAQQCFTLSSNLASYTDESTDGSYIYTSVEIDGSEQMTINPTCAPYLPQYYHTPMVYNYLSIPGGRERWRLGFWIRYLPELLPLFYERPKYSCESGSGCEL
jgi:hypothetical protein